MIPSLLLNVIKTLVIDKAQSLAIEHVKDAISSNLNEQQQELLDEIINEDKAHSFNNLSDFISK